MKIKLRDLTEDQYRKWYDKNCGIKNCWECPFDKVYCDLDENFCWIKNKDLYSDKFLNQEVEVDKSILTAKEKEYLSAVIKPFREEIEYIAKYDDILNDTKTQKLGIVLSSNVLWLPHFKKNKYYKNMKVAKQYTLEELGL